MKTRKGQPLIAKVDLRNIDGELIISHGETVFVHGIREHDDGSCEIGVNTVDGRELEFCDRNDFETINKAQTL